MNYMGWLCLFLGVATPGDGRSNPLGFETFILCTFTLLPLLLGHISFLFSRRSVGDSTCVVHSLQSHIIENTTPILNDPFGSVTIMKPLWKQSAVKPNLLLSFCVA